MLLSTPTISNSRPRKLRIGTRGSRLAFTQAEWVASRLRERQTASEFVTIQTTGDQDQRPLSEIAAPGLFTKQIQQCLVDGTIDLAVHSLKDLPVHEFPGLCLIAIPVRERVADVLVSGDGCLLTELRTGAIVGTDSPRRTALLLWMRPDLSVQPIRGNVETRVALVRDGTYDACVLAEAGLRRLGLEHEIAEVLPPETFVPAAGQGALAVEVREEDDGVHDLITPLDDLWLRHAVWAERAVLRSLRAGCHAPAGAWARWSESTLLQLIAIVAAPDGREVIRVEGKVTIPHLDASTIRQADFLGETLAGQLMDQGAARYLSS